MCLKYIAYLWSDGKCISMLRLCQHIVFFKHIELSGSVYRKVKFRCIYQDNIKPEADLYVTQISHRIILRILFYFYFCSNRWSLEHVISIVKSSEMIFIIKLVLVQIYLLVQNTFFICPEIANDWNDYVIKLI